jgi:zinc protease
MLREFARRELTKDRLHVAVAGDITAEELAPLLDSVFGALPEKAPVSPVNDLVIQNNGAAALYPRDIPQTIINIMQPGIDRADPDYYAAMVMNYILGGGGFGSRLMEELREKRGLTYGVYTRFLHLDHTDALMLSTSTENENAGQAMEIIRGEWQAMRDKPVTESELIMAKNYLIGSMPLMLTSTDRIAGLMLSLQLDGLPIDYLDGRADKIDSVTAQDIAEIAQKLLVPDGLTVVFVGSPQGVTPTRTVESLPNVE